MKKIISLFAICSMMVLFATAQNVGIGNSNPQYKLDVSGRMQLRGSTDYNNSAGLWLGGAGADSAVKKIFIGMRADSSAGFYSGRSDVGWGLVFDGRIGTVGIGNPDPSFPLSFKDMSGDKISLYREGSNYYGLGVGNATMQLITANSTSDILMGYGRSAVFTENMRIKGNGRVGIGTANPNATIEAKSNITGIPILRLSGVNEAYQDFYPLGTNGGRYGWLGFSASEPDKFFLYNDRNGDMSFITGGGERLTLKNNGNVGIGVSDPVYPLDISNRIRIRGKPGFSAGTWLNNEANTGIPAFIGMQADNQVGFYGSGTGWSFLMNTQTGAVSFGGNAGQPGQVLVSNGNTAGAAWTTMGALVEYAEATGNFVKITSGVQAQDVPRSSVTITITRKCRLLYRADVNGFGPNCIGCPPSVARFGVLINGNIIDLTDNYLMTLPNHYIALSPTTRTSGMLSVSAPVVIANPGTHTMHMTVTTYRSNDYQPIYNLFAVSASIIAIPVD